MQWSEALEAGNRMHAPYSHSHSGVAALGTAADIYSGTYIENAAFGGTAAALQAALIFMNMAGGDHARHPPRPCWWKASNATLSVGKYLCHRRPGSVRISPCSAINSVFAEADTHLFVISLCMILNINLSPSPFHIGITNFVTITVHIFSDNLGSVRPVLKCQLAKSSHTWNWNTKANDALYIPYAGLSC